MGDFSSRELETLIRYHRDDTDSDISFQRIVTGKFNTSYFVNAGNKQLVLRIAPSPDEVFVFYERDMMRQEPEIHHLLLSQTSVPVPQILTYDNSRTLINRDFLIMERLPGLPLTETYGIPNDLVLRQVGEHLAQVHSLVGEKYGYGYLGAHLSMEPQPTWLDAFEVM